MGFFDKETFDTQKEAIAKDAERATFDWDGRFIAHIDSAMITKCTKPGNDFGAQRFMVNLTIDKVLENQDKKSLSLAAGSKVLIYQGKVGRIGETVNRMLPGMLGCDPENITHDMGNDLVDDKINYITVGDTKICYEGVPYFFDRIREHYTGSDDLPKSYTPEGLTRPLTLAEVEEHGIKISDEVKAVLELLN